MLIKLFLLCVMLGVGSTEKVRYDNYALYKVHPQSHEDVRFLKDLEENNGDLDFWKSVRNVGDYASVVAPPELRKDLEHSLSKRSIQSELMMENIQDAMDAQVVSRRKRDLELYWTNYQTMDEIYEWFDHLVVTHSFVSLIELGKTHEGRNITGIRISRGSGNRNIILEGGQVGADWLSPTVLTYVVNQLVQGEDSEARAASEDFVWHIFPVLNPDGHQFSQDYVRLWTKNRRPTSSSTYGVDLTRNWNSQWGKSTLKCYDELDPYEHKLQLQVTETRIFRGARVIGASFEPSANNYAGLGPFSEIETRSLSRYIESIGRSLTVYLSFRGFGQRFLIPFAHSTAPMYNYAEVMTIGRRAMGSLSVRYGTHYLVGTSAQVHDGATGAVADWVKYRFNPPIVATYQLRDNGAAGYILPVNQVQPSCEETYDSLMAILREASNTNVI